MDTQAIAGVQTTVLDHHGLVAAKCKDFKLAERIDCILKPNTQRIVSPGVACVAMVINGLGFTNRRLYLTPQFFEGKPLQDLLGVALEARHLNDDALGDALDAIADYGPSKLFGEVAIPIALEHKLLDGFIHTETTSFCVEGEYKNSTPAPAAQAATAATAAAVGTAAAEGNPGEARTIHITHGYSKDHLPDLKQAVLSLAVAGRNPVAIGHALSSKGRFILATNDLDKETYPDAQLLADYKAQQTEERGFRFLKNPEFLAATFYLKSPKRIAALMMLMTLCLLVYNVTQFELREKLEAQKATLPNQLGKPTQAPILRWVFQLMEGVAVVSVFNLGGALIHHSVANLNEVRTKIIRLFGPSACKIYGIEG